MRRVPAAVDPEGPTEASRALSELAEAEAAPHRDIVGRTVGERYRILGLLGVGGMGAVYRAEHEAMERTVVVKLLLPEVSRHPIARERFSREARAMNRIRHPNVREVLDLGRTDDDQLYMVMEYLEGEPLRDRIARGPLRAAELLPIVLQVCSALRAAHEIGIVHRDVTPSNIFLCPPREDGEPPQAKVLDFGIALMKAAVRLTRPGEMLGTPYYMAPETIRGEEATRQADVYAVGAVMHEALAGAPPFAADGLGDLMIMHLEASPPPLAGRPGVPDALAELVIRCLAKDPAERPAGMEEVAERAAEVLRRLDAAPFAEPAPVRFAATLPLDAAPLVPPALDALAESASGLPAWNAFLDRARAWAARCRSRESALRVGELEFAVNGIVAARADAAAVAEAIAEAERREAATRERFERALASLEGECGRTAENIRALQETVKSARRDHEAVRAELSRARSELWRADPPVGPSGTLRAGVGPPDPGAETYEPFLAAYAAAGKAAEACAAARRRERDAEAALAAAREEAADLVFQAERLVEGRDRAIEGLAVEREAAHDRSEALEARCADLYRKLIETAALVQASSGAPESGRRRDGR